ncbi:tRNA (adenosine(37)-N6)-threonylcarbamoyltransferase complex dimerization subunit type 1 TsaB [Orbaceae bacterium ESL0721]|nr:tRNA (adenosine(37)-N6)-threonylcarbamoyltransferase complex dimerization subunit type 1 TsaB [Orbaceae bacterium ESL0721]
MHTLLAIDTSTEACSVALLYRDEITANFTLSNRDHTKQILPMIDELLNQSGCNLSQIDAIAYGQGPGSFTGVRIGIGVAQGLALGIDRPMIGVSTLMTLAQGAFRNKNATDVISAIDARMGEIYLGYYHRQSNDEWQPLISEIVINPADIAEKVPNISQAFSAGTGWQTYPTMLPNIEDSGILLPQAEDLIVIAKQKWLKGEIADVANIEPTYLRNEVTWKKLPGR